MSRQPTKLKPATVKRELQRIDETIRDLQRHAALVKSRCAHDWRYIPDPSGNNDSEYECRACGEYSSTKGTP